jgi:hypothetical protein
VSEKLTALASRIENDGYFLAAALTTYAQSERITDERLAKLLGCDPLRLTALRLCRMPDTRSTEFSHEVDRIATRFKVNAELLAEAVRRWSALIAMRSEESAGSDGLLMAARDRPTPSAEHDEERES